MELPSMAKFSNFMLSLPLNVLPLFIVSCCKESICFAPYFFQHSGQLVFAKVLNALQEILLRVFKCLLFADTKKKVRSGERMVRNELKVRKMFLRGKLIKL